MIRLLDGLLTLDHSALSTYGRCPRRAYYEHVRGWQEQEIPEKLLCGIVAHQAVSEVYKSYRMRKAPEGSIIADRRILEPWNEMKILSRELPHVAEAIGDRTGQLKRAVLVRAGIRAHYYLWSQDVDAGLNVVDVERKQRELMELNGARFWLTHVADVVVEDELGATHIIDHKYTQSYSQSMAVEKAGSAQFLLYQLARTGRPGTAFINFIIDRSVFGLGREQCPGCKNGSKKKLECETCDALGHVPTSKPIFHRESIAIGHDRLDAARDYVRAKFWELEREQHLWDRDRGLAWHQEPDACRVPGRGTCPFINVCWHGKAPWWERELGDGFVKREREDGGGEDICQM